ICETTSGVKSYSGYVNLPPAPAERRSYPLHTWFWFFEARNNPQTAPLTLWLQGGPGAPTAPAAVGENGPCAILPNSRDSVLNKWSWNEHVSLLYIDQPVQTGFSYDTLINGSIIEPFSPYEVFPSAVDNDTTVAGTFSSQNGALAPNSTNLSTIALWQVLQVWFQEFPGYESNEGKFSIWAESYEGHYGPTLADYINTQNERIASGELSTQSSKPLYLETLGLVNACIDLTTQMPLYPVMAVNNTYGISVVNDSVYAASVDAIPQCLNLTATCREAVVSLDPQGWGNNTAVNDACLDAYDFCFTKNFYHFDIAAPAINSFPPRWAAGYLNDADVQQALGVPLNFTGNSDKISAEFFLAGDFVKGKNLEILGQLLDRGVKVALMYGDRDYQCNWFGGEAVSLAINSSSSSAFQRAGYTNINTNSSYVGGLVRQYGNLSFSRVFQAGHEVPYYQPETAYQIFNRVMFDLDVATGTLATNVSSSSDDGSDGAIYSTTGSSSAITLGTKNTPVSFEAQAQCYFWDILETCTPSEKAIFSNGSAITEDWILVGYKLPDGTL
ncbi:Alpha/Beta hydrolase protein, partial [Xylariales sp. PMI_506]